MKRMVNDVKRAKDLFDKIASMDNLREAHRNARKGKSKYAQVRMVDRDPEKYLGKIHDMLVNGTYKTSDYRTFIVNDRGKDREIYDLPYYPDRIVHWAIMLVIEPIFLKMFIHTTYAAIPGRGIHQGLYELHKHMKDRDATRYCLKIDVAKFFPHVDTDILKRFLRKRIKCAKTLDLLDEIIDSCDKPGIPIGNYTSQYFGNYYLSWFDHWLKENKHPYTYVNENNETVTEMRKVEHYFRYMDDVIVLSDSKEWLHQLCKEMAAWLKENLNLDLKSNYQVFPTYKRGVDFIGYRSYGDFTLLRSRTKRIIKELSKDLQDKIAAGYSLTPTELGSVASYYGAIAWGDTYHLFCKTFRELRILPEYKRRSKPKKSKKPKSANKGVK